ncbi:hypothetical protein ACA910_012884 [Epithemia clementina (nom. ined.)]
MSATAPESDPPPPPPPSNEKRPPPPSPGQSATPKPPDLSHHGYILRFEFTPSPSAPKTRTTAPDTFNAVEALRSLADALFTSNGEVCIHNGTNTTTIQSLQECPSNDKQFQEFFEVSIPDSGKAKAYVRFEITTSLEYKILKQDGTLYNYLRVNSIYMTLHQFGDIETTIAGQTPEDYVLAALPGITLREKGQNISPARIPHNNGPTTPISNKLNSQSRRRHTS